MRAFVPNYELQTPASLGEALAILAKDPHVWRPIAGGTDLMVLFEAGHLDEGRYLNILPFKELQGIKTTDQYVVMGALTTFTEIQGHSVLKDDFPNLCQAAWVTGGKAIQNRGTLGGNIVNASPAGDSLPALLSYNAEVELVSSSGARWIPYDSFHTGYKKTELKANELIKSVRIPRVKGKLQQYYRKVGTRKAQAISKVVMAAVAICEDGLISDIRLAWGSVAPVPLRTYETEKFLKHKKLDAAVIKKAKEVLAKELTPIDDIRSTSEYRRVVSGNLLEEFLTSF
jgi:CO/xanthine dehydrogenase FAD-binding subunit